MEPADAEGAVPTWAGTATLLLASYLLANGAAVALIAAMGSRPQTVVAAIAVGAGLGLLCSAALQRNLYLISLALSRLARGWPAQPLQPRLRWPLGNMLADVNALGRLVGDQARWEQETSEYRAELLQRVSATAAQEERNRLARDLHDSIKQQLFSISMSAAATEARWDTDPAGARLAVAGAQRSAQEALVEMEALLQHLRPAELQSVGLREAVQTQCEALSYRTGAEVRLARFDLPHEELLPAATKETIFRIVQEALSNVARHARARAVSVEVGRHDDSIILQIRDDGQGFDPASTTSGSGLAGIRERAQSLGGNVELESVPDKGTLVRVHIPLRRSPPVGAETQESNRLRQDRENAIKLSTFMEQVTAVLIFLAAPIAAVVLGAAVSLFLYGRARLVAAQMAVRPGGDQLDDIRNQYQERGLLAGALGIIGLCVLYLFVAVPGWDLHLHRWLVIGPAAAIEAAAAILTVRWYRGIDCYLGRLSGPERQRAVDRRLLTLRDSIVLWLIIVIIALSVGFSLRFPPHTLNQWADDSTLVILALWPLLDAGDYVISARWRRRLSAVAI